AGLPTQTGPLLGPESQKPRPENKCFDVTSSGIRGFTEGQTEAPAKQAVTKVKPDAKDSLHDFRIKVFCEDSLSSVSCDA
ncbi:MAG TPA: hypothetical protein VN048_02310, partial [Verrucomicrobiae bacterium]|nr:hypothetical protein [Verrucomicrobiae bacterium]